MFGLSNPWVTRDSTSLIISESPGLFGLSNPFVTRDSSSLMISESLRLLGLSNPCVTRDSSSLIICDSLGTVWAVESMHHTSQQFVDYLRVPRGCLGCRHHESPVTAVH
jgi:hypothetical protein